MKEVEHMNIELRLETPADYVAAGNILMAGVELIREGRLEPKKVKATLRGKPAKATNVKLGPGWADVMPVEPERCLGKLRCQTRYEAGSPSFNEGRSHMCLRSTNGI